MFGKYPDVGILTIEELLVAIEHQQCDKLAKRLQSYHRNPLIFMEYMRMQVRDAEQMRLCVMLYNAIKKKYPDLIPTTEQSLFISYCLDYESERFPRAIGMLAASQVDDYQTYHESFIALAENSASAEAALIFIENIKSETIKEKILTEFLGVCVDKYNAHLFFGLNCQYPDLASRLINKLDHDKCTTAINLLSLSETKERQYFCNNMHRLVKGFGSLDYDSALLTCAQIASRKPYQFDPVILRDHLDEFRLMVEVFATSTLSVQRFILTGSHWVCGEIRQSQHKASIFILDSMGFDAYSSAGKWLPGIPDELISTFANIFRDKEVAGYFSYEVRQRSAYGCSVFALDDLRHLFTVEQYLSSQYKNSGLFGYLQDNKVCTVQSGSIHVLVARLPLVFMRTMQSRALYQDVIPSRPKEERLLPVDKRGRDALTIATAAFRQDDNGETRNMRLKDKLARLVYHNAEYLFKTDSQLVEQQKQLFSFGEFQKKVLLKRIDSEPQSPRRVRK